MPHSKTDTPCDCNYLQTAADDPAQPIKFDPQLNEFHIVYSAPHGEAYMMIYHCPFCGGKAPKSRRSSLFTKPSPEEQRRLIEMTKLLKTLDDLLLALGPPDRDMEAGETFTTPEKDGQPSVTRAYRTLLYRNLSETADVHVRVYPTEQVAISFRGKYQGEKTNKPAS